MKKIFFFFLLSLSLFSCKEIQPVTVGGIENPKLKNLSKDGIEFDFGMRINNPNGFGVSVFPSKFDVTVNGVEVGKVRLEKKVRIKAKSDEVTMVHIKSDFSLISISNIAGMLSIAMSKHADLSMKGNFRVGKWFYKKKFPVDLSKNISLSK